MHFTLNGRSYLLVAMLFPIITQTHTHTYTRAVHSHHHDSIKFFIFYLFTYFMVYFQYIEFIDHSFNVLGYLFRIAR